MRSRCDVISGSLCLLVHTADTRTHTSHTIEYYHFATHYTHMTCTCTCTCTHVGMHMSHADKPHPLITPPSTAVSRHACGRPRRGAEWQLCCRIGHTTTVACQVVGSRSSCHRLQTATGAERCANAGTAQRARNGRRAYPANRHHVWSTSASAGARACGV
jgi:hypothetical protein